MFTDDVHSKYDILNHLYFSPNFFFFFWTAFGCFIASTCFSICRLMVADISTQSPHHKKALGSQYASVTQCSEYARICLNLR